MYKKVKNKNANNIMWVEYWIRKAHPSCEEYELLAQRYDDYRWICEINLPLINKTVTSISEKEVNAMLNASNKAAKLIAEYMKEHPELDIKNEFKGKRWEIVSDEDGRFISTTISKAWVKRQNRQVEKVMADQLEVVKTAIKKIAKITGSSKNLFIQVLDESLFDDDMSINMMLEEVFSKSKKEYHLQQQMVGYDRDSGSVIVIGYTAPATEKGELD